MSKKKNMCSSIDMRLLLCGEEELKRPNNIWDVMNEADEVESVGSDEDPA